MNFFQNKLKSVIKIFSLMFLSLFFVVNISYAEEVHTERPEYVNYVTIGGHDIYIDKYRNIFAFKDGKINLVEERRYGYDWEFYELEEMAYEARNNHIDKDENLYFEYRRDWSGDKLYKIDKNLNVEELSDNVDNFVVVDGVLFYIVKGEAKVIKYENNIKEVVFDLEGKKYLYINKIDDHSFYVSTSTNLQDYYMYKEGVFTKIESDKKEVESKDRYIKPNFEEKIENYHKATLSEISTESEIDIEEEK